MKRTSSLKSVLVGLGLISAVATTSAAVDLVLGTFDSDVSGWGTAWGNARAQFDPAEDNTGNGGGSCYISGDFSADQNTLTIYGVIEGNPWWHPTSASFNLSEYASIEFDIKWDTSQSLSIAEFNSPPLGGEGGITIWAVDYPGFSILPTIANIQVPEAAATGWVHVSVPINPTIAGIDPSKGIVFKKWITAAQRDAGGTYGFWVDNVILKGTTPPPPPSLSLEKPVPGLAFIAASGGQWDRQNIRTLGDGYSWVGAQGPVSYSMTVAKLADNDHPNFQLHIYFVPGTPDDRADADWHEPNVLMWRINNLADGAAWSEVRYKTNSPDDNGILWGAGNLGGVWSPTPLGTWTITFDHDTNITVTTPAGGTLVTNFPPELVPIFNNTMKIYVGAVPNSLDRIGQMAVLTNVKITGTPNAAPVNSDFLGQPLDTNVWEILAASPTLGVQQIPTDAAYWVMWTLPALGFALEGSPTVNGPWTSPAPTGFDVGGKHRVLLRQADLPSPEAGFWRLVKREFKKLQILLPGETAAPGTPTGKTGTPIPQTAGVPFEVIVNAVDDNWNIAPIAMDVVRLTSSDEWAELPQQAALVRGTRTFTVTLWTQGEQTITVTDVTDPSKADATSSPVTVQ